MRYVLDTDTCVAIIRRRPQAALVRLFALQPGDTGVSAVTVAELSYGVRKSGDQGRNAEALALFLAPLAILPFGEAAAAAYGQVRARLESSGEPIGSMDMLIAAHVLALDATLVTGNVREFARIPGLAVENWMAPPAGGGRER